MGTNFTYLVFKIATSASQVFCFKKRLLFCGWWTCDSILYDLTRHDIFVDNLYMLISIRASMLMPESHHMAQLMNNNPKLVTVFPDRYGLGTVSPLAHKWATPTRHRFYVLRLSCLQLIHLAMRCVRLYKQRST